MGLEKELFTEEDLHSFTELEFEIYNFIRQNGNKIPYMTIRELSEEAHVSTTTVVNFCKKLGCDGFSEFKVIYKLWRKKKNNAFIEPLDVSLEVFWNHVVTKEFTDMLDTVSQLVHDAKFLVMVGFGNSAVMARYATNYFSTLGKFCSCIENPFYDLGTIDLDAGVIIMFSVSGEVKNFLPLFNVSKNSKTTLVSITNNGNNMLAKLSHYNIPYHVRYDVLPGIMSFMDYTTQVPVMYIIETLAKKAYALMLEET